MILLCLQLAHGCMGLAVLRSLFLSLANHRVGADNTGGRSNCPCQLPFCICEVADVSLHVALGALAPSVRGTHEMLPSQCLHHEAFGA